MEICFWDNRTTIDKPVPLLPINTRVPADIEGLTVSLFDHQQLAVRAMLDLEDRRKITVRGMQSRDIYTSAGILAEPFGAGKTIECLALMKLCQQPEFKPISIHTKPPSYKDTRTGYRLVTAGKLVRPNLVIVGASVFNQWLSCITDIGDFTVLTVHNSRTFGDLVKAIDNNTLDTYDIVLVKSGDATAASVSKSIQEKYLKYYSYLDESDTYALPTCIAMIAPNYIWSRVIIDDYDTISLKTDKGAPVGRFTWYISATQKRSARSTYVYNEKYNTRVIDKSFLHRVTLDENLSRYFTVANSMDYIRECINIYKPRFWVHYIKRVMPRIVNFIANDNGLGDICREMINSDAIGTLAEMLGLKTDNIMVIFEKMLSDKFDKYKDTLLYHENIRKAREVCNARFNNYRPPVDYYKGFGNGAKQENVKSEIKKCIKDGKFDMIPWIPNMDQYLEGLYEKVGDEIDEQDKALKRLRDNFRNDECSICLLEFENNVFILKCCGYSICETCVHKGTQMNTSRSKLDGSCPNCKSPITFTDLIALDPSIDIKQLTDEEVFKSQLIKAQNEAQKTTDEVQTVINQVAEHEEKRDDSDDDGDLIAAQVNEAANANQLPAIDYDKLHAKVKVLYDIVNDVLPKRDVPVTTKRNIATNLFNQICNMQENNRSYELDEKLMNIISSDVILDRPPTEKKKIIVFANYCETLTIVRDQLPGMTMILHGTAKQMHYQLREFKNNDIPILLINSQKHCAGINAQFASDLVFFHKIINPALEAQVEGRIQRLGRKYSANIHFILYNNEML